MDIRKYHWPYLRVAQRSCRKFNSSWMWCTAGRVVSDISQRRYTERHSITYQKAWIFIIYWTCNAAFLYRNTLSQTCFNGILLWRIVMHICIEVDAAPSCLWCWCMSQCSDGGQRYRHAVIANLNKEQSQVNAIRIAIWYWFIIFIFKTAGCIVMLATKHISAGNSQGYQHHIGVWLRWMTYCVQMIS